MGVKSFYLKVGSLRFYSGNTPPYWFEVPFRGTVTAPIDRPRPGETIIVDRGRLSPAMHYVVGNDESILQPVSFSCQFRLTNSEPNYSKMLTLIRATGGGNTKLFTPKVWQSTKGTTQIYNADPEGAQLVSTPTFADSEKFCVNVELLWSDSDGSNDRGFRWAEVYFPPDRQLTEGETDVMIDLTGEIYGAIVPITAFTVGTES